MPGKVDSRAMREVNRSIVLDMIRQGGRISRTDLARRSALTKPTVSAIVEELIADGIVHEVGLGKAVPSGGRRARLLEFNEDSAAYLGIRFGAHRTTVAVSDARGHIRATCDLPTKLGDPEASVRAAVELTSEALSAAEVPRKRLRAAGVAVAGLVDVYTGSCVLAPNLGWKDFSLRAALEAELQMPVVVSNVTDAAAIAEGRLGVAKGARTFVWVYVGTGIGAGIVIDGQIFYGRRGFSGEIGHCRMTANGPILEDLASGRAIAERGSKVVTEGRKTSLAELGRPPSALDVCSAAADGDAEATAIVVEAGRSLGVGMAYLLNILNPEVLVIGGPLADDLLLEHARVAMNEHTLEPETVQMMKSGLGDRAPTAGAVLSAMDHLVQSYRIVAAAPFMVDG